MAVHETVPDFAKKTKPEMLREGLKIHLPHGKAKAMTAADLMRAMGYKPNGTCASLRMAAKMMLEDGVPVVSCSKGFFLAETLEELAEFKENLEAQMAGLARDMMAVTRIQVKRGLF